MIKLLTTQAAEPTKWENFIASLDIMWKGLFAIFLVIGLIVTITLITNSIINKSIAKKNVRIDEYLEDDDDEYDDME